MFFFIFFYQIFILSSGALYILSPGFVSNTLWNASIFSKVPFTRNIFGECESVFAKFFKYSGVDFWRHILAKLKKNNLFIVSG